MAKYLGADQNQVMWQFESGTYGVATGSVLWLGMVQSHEADEGMGVMNVRYVGGTSRNVDQFVDGPTTYENTATYYVQDWRCLYLALGSCLDASGLTSTHTIKEANSDHNNDEIGGTQVLPSFTVEDAQVTATGSNFIRTFDGGMVDTLGLTATEGEPITAEMAYPASTMTFSSGARTGVTADTNAPYMWQHSKFYLPSGTTTQMTEVKTIALTINNNLERPNYCDGTRGIAAPIPTQRDYELALTINATDIWTKNLYDKYYVGGSTFNALWAITQSAGSRLVEMTFSGCKITDMAAPSTGEGVNEQTITVTPQAMSAVAKDTIVFYRLGSYA